MRAANPGLGFTGPRLMLHSYYLDMLTSGHKKTPREALAVKLAQSSLLLPCLPTF